MNLGLIYYFLFFKILDGEHWLNPDDTNTILRLCQTDAELISGDRSLPCESPDLIPKLRPYQKAAVQWMLQKEKNSGNCFVNFSGEPLTTWLLFRRLKMRKNCVLGCFFFNFCFWPLKVEGNFVWGGVCFSFFLISTK